MKNNVLVPSTRPGMPWASRPISFLNQFHHTSLYHGMIQIWQYSIISPISPSDTDPEISQNNLIGDFRDAKCIGVAGVFVSSMHWSMTSWVSVFRLDLVFFTGLSPSFFEILFCFGGHGCCFLSTDLCGSVYGNFGDVTTISFSPNGYLSYGGELHGVCMRVTLCGVMIFSRTLCGGGS